MTAVAFGLFGLIVGSFLNVLILRHGKFALSGRSVCTSCGKHIAAFDLIPVLSWLILHGRCRACGAALSAQYPLVEIATCLAFILIGAAPLPLVIRLLALPIVALLIAITVYDLYHTIIPDAWVYPFAGLALFASLLGVQDSREALEVLVAGVVVAAPLFFLWFYSKGAWMGLGDAKLALGMGWLLGLSAGITALFLAFILGALVSLPLLFFSSNAWRLFRERLIPRSGLVARSAGFTMKSEIAFGPFLIASCLLIWFLGIYGIPLPFGFFGAL